jgi:hypothetical protein
MSNSASIRTKRSHHLYFAEAPDWRVLDATAPGKPSPSSAHFQKGSGAVLRSRDFSNQSIRCQTGSLDADLRRHRLRSSRMIFDEQHFGMTESGTVVGLARRFRLGGMAIGLALCAALFIWKNACQLSSAGRPCPRGAALRPHFAFGIAHAAPPPYQARRSGGRRAGANGSPPIAATSRPSVCARAEAILRDRGRAAARSRARNPNRLACERTALNLDQFQAAAENILAGIRKVIIGQDEAIRYSLVVVLTNQHALIEGVPGLGKTLLARTLAACAGRRVQTHSVHPRPDARRHHRHPHLQPCSATSSRW